MIDSSATAVTTPLATTPAGSKSLLAGLAGCSSQSLLFSLLSTTALLWLLSVRVQSLAGR